VRLRVEIAVGREETHPPTRRVQTVAASLSSATSMLGLVTKGATAKPVSTQSIIFNDVYMYPIAF
jgi:hypothetical protein